MDNPVFDFWNKLMINMWSKSAMSSGANPFDWFAQSNRGKGPWESTLEMTQAISESFAAFSGDKKQAGEADSLSDLVSNMMQIGFEGYLDLQKKWFDDVRKGNAPVHEIESLSHAPLIWLESIHKMLDIVPNAGVSGPPRDVLKKYTAFSTKMSELLYQLYLPMDKASKAWAEKMDVMRKEGKVPQNMEESSGVWFSAIESSLLDLIKSPDYTQLLHETADSYEQYREMRQQVYGQSAKAGPKPRDRGVDALSDEISMLREKLEELLQKVDSQTSRPTSGSPNEREAG